MMKLYIEDDAGNVRVVPVEGQRITIGRAADNSVVIPERNVSRHHATVDLSNGRIRLQDVKARYGIRINGVLIPGSIELDPGDFFQIGDYQFKFLARDAAISETSDQVDSEVPMKATSRSRQVRASQPDTPTRSLMELQDIEAVARMGWRSDFFDEEVASSGRGLLARLALLVILILVAAGLAFAYYKLYIEEPYVDFGRSAVPARTYDAPEPAPEPQGREPAVAAVAPEPADSEPAPADDPVDEPDREPVAAKAAPPERPLQPAPAPAPPAEKPVIQARATAQQAAPAPKPAPAAPAPKPAAAAPAPKPSRVAAADPSTQTATSGTDSQSLLEEIDLAIAQGDLDRAVSLLGKCRGSGCLRRQKQIGYRYQGLGNMDKAIDAWKRAYRMTRDPREQEGIRRIVRDLGGSVD